MSVTFFYICKRKFTIINKKVDNKKNVIKWTIYNHYQLKVRDVKLY